MKTKVIFICRNCQWEAVKWVGKCPNCEQWNTLEETKLQGAAIKRGASRKQEHGQEVMLLRDVPDHGTVRYVSQDAEWNRVLGGGLVEGSVILLAGEPGIGKSTLLLQWSVQEPGRKALYVSGEESAEQVKLRAERLGIGQSECLILTDSHLETVIEAMKKHRPDWVIIDSIQTMRSETVEGTPGSIIQIRECAAGLVEYAKRSAIPIILVGHITKDGSIAGPKILEHMVDTVLYYEGDRNYAYRLLRSIKNRFGPTGAIGIYEMLESGLRQVSNPSELLLTIRDNPVSGTAIGCIMEGGRVFMIEVQALVSPSLYGTSQRTANGIDSKRLNMLLAVLEKRCGIPFGQQDVFINITGGLKVDDPALDAAVAMALCSSYQEKPLGDHVCFMGEVGLSGELRSVSHMEQRIAEGLHLGFDQIAIGSTGAKKVSSSPEMSKRGADTKVSSFGLLIDLGAKYRVM